MAWSLAETGRPLRPILPGPAGLDTVLEDHGESFMIWGAEGRGPWRSALALEAAHAPEAVGSREERGARGSRISVLGPQASLRQTGHTLRT